MINRKEGRVFEAYGKSEGEHSDNHVIAKYFHLLKKRVCLYMIDIQ